MVLEDASGFAETSESGDVLQKKKKKKRSAPILFMRSLSTFKYTVQIHYGVLQVIIYNDNYISTN